MADISEPEFEPNKDDTPESLEAKLQAYARAVRTEFETSEQAKEAGNENAEQFSIDFAKENLANNLAQVQWLAQNSTTDNVRLSAAKYMIQLAREDAANEGDPIKNLLNELSGKRLPKTDKSKATR